MLEVEAVLEVAAVPEDETELDVVKELGAEVEDLGVEKELGLEDALHFEHDIDEGEDVIDRQVVEDDPTGIMMRSLVHPSATAYRPPEARATNPRPLGLQQRSSGRRDGGSARPECSAVYDPGSDQAEGTVIGAAGTLSPATGRVDVTAGAITMGAGVEGATST